MHGSGVLLFEEGPRAWDGLYFGSISSIGRDSGQDGADRQGWFYMRMMRGGYGSRQA